MEFFAFWVCYGFSPPFFTEIFQGCRFWHFLLGKLPVILAVFRIGFANTKRRPFAMRSSEKRRFRRQVADVKVLGTFASFKVVSSYSAARPTGASSRPSLIVFARARKAHRFVAPPCPTKSLDFAGAPPLWSLCGSVALQRRTLAFFGKGHRGLGQRAGIQLCFSDKKRRLHKQHKKREQVLSFWVCAEPYVNDFEIQSEANARSERDKTRRFRPPVASIL